MILFAMSESLRILIGEQGLEGEICCVEPARGLVVFAHGSGSSRNSRRNRAVAQTMQRHGLGTMLFDLLTPEEAEDRANVFDIPLLAQRVLVALDALPAKAHGLPLGLFGASTGAAAALVAAASRPDSVQAVVSRGGRPDLAGDHLAQVRAPTLLIIGGADTDVLELNREAYALLQCEKRINVVPRATHLFQEAGALEAVARLTVDWFLQHLRIAY
jgi:pimeloyl-ACP methyl ester carboxylesterase